MRLGGLWESSNELPLYVSPSKQPTAITALPTNVPTLAPTSAPTNTPTYQPTCETIDYGWNCFLGQIDGTPAGRCDQYNANGEFNMGAGVWEFRYNPNFDDNNIILS
eukprot:968064_1